VAAALAAAAPALAQLAAPSRIGVFEMRDGVTLTGADRSAILAVATRASDHTIKKVVVRALPFRTLQAQVTYRQDLSDTTVIETRLDVFRRGGPLLSPEFDTSLDIRQGDWATRADLAVPELRRRFRLDGIEVTLRQPVDVSYDELYDLLRQLGRRAVTWKDPAGAFDIRLANVEDISVSGPPRRYHLFVVSPAVVPTLYILDAEFDGTYVTITRSAAVRP